jgi:hypothetical protein
MYVYDVLSLSRLFWSNDIRLDDWNKMWTKGIVNLDIYLHTRMIMYGYFKT